MLNVFLLGISNADFLCCELQKNQNYSPIVISDSVHIIDGNDTVCIFGSEFTDGVSQFSVKKIIAFEKQDINTELVRSANADDFVALPISVNELTARIELLFEDRSFLEKNGLFVDFKSCRVLINGRLLHLTLLEYKLLCLLAKSHGSLVTYEKILKELWETPIGNEMLSIRVFVNAIRRKFKAAGAMETLIKTHSGKGYSLNLD